MPKSDILKVIDELDQGADQLAWDNTMDPALLKTPDVPTGITITATVDGVLIYVDPLVDTSHTSVANFEAYIVYARPFGADDGEGDTIGDQSTEIGRIPYGHSSLTWQPPSGGYTGYDIALTGISNTGCESAKSTFQRAVLSTFFDDFSEYGGSTLSPLESLNWLGIDQADSLTGWSEIVSGTLSLVASPLVEGSKAIKDQAHIGASETEGWARLTKTMDLSVEGRFTDTDYVCWWQYNERNISSGLIYFYNPAFTKAFYAVLTPAEKTAGAHFIKKLKSGFTADSGADWANIGSVDIYAQIGDTDGFYFIIDDLRIVKASPSDADEFSDTGDAWKTNAGTWHVYPGNRTGEPALPFTFGQIATPDAGDFYFATAQNINVVHGRMAVPVYIKGADGMAGPVFRCADDTAGSEDCLAALIDTDADKLWLLQWEAGGDAATTNLCENPSLETDTTGWAAWTSSIARATTDYYYGAASLEVTPTPGNSYAGAYYPITLAASTAHAIRVKVNGTYGVPYHLYLYDPAGLGTIIAFEPFTGEGDWQDVQLPVTTNGSTAFRIFITKWLDADNTPFYIDGLQVEAAAVSTAYCDGSLGYGYAWTGTAHASTSTRVEGTPVTVTSVDYTTAPDTLYWLGVDFRDPDNTRRVKVYAGTSQSDLFTAAALKISTTTTLLWPDGGGIGLVCRDDTNCRFGEVRAGSPQTADYAHRAGYAAVAGIASVATILTSPLETVTGDTTLTAAQFSVLIDATSNTVTVTLPAAASYVGRVYVVKCINADYTATVACADHIEGVLDSIEFTVGESLMVQSDGTTWWVLSAFNPGA